MIAGSLAYAIFLVVLSVAQCEVLILVCAGAAEFHIQEPLGSGLIGTYLAIQ
jgi:hypothetical protein